MPQYLALRSLVLPIADPTANIVLAEFSMGPISAIVVAALNLPAMEAVDGDTLTTISVSVADMHYSSAPSTMSRTVPFTNESLKEAVELWCQNKAAAAAELGDISVWNTSQVTSMRELFKARQVFNDYIDNWDVSNVTDMYGMFWNASSFNQLLDSWNVSKVMTMRSMFAEASAFNQPLNSWDVRTVTDMSYMFSYASSFNQPLHSWDVKSVTNMYCMFYHAVSLTSR
jgi:surface protein